MMREIYDAVVGNTRDLSRISEKLSSHPDFREVVIDLKNRLDLIDKILLIGNGRPSVAQQIAELNVRVEALKKGEHKPNKSIDIFLRWGLPALIAGAVELLSHLVH